MLNTITVPVLDAGDEFIICATNQSSFSTTELMTPVDEILVDKFMDIQFYVESDSCLKNLDYTMLEMDEIADIVETHADLL